MTGQVNEAVAWLYTYPHDGESDHCLSASRLLPSWVAAKGATEQPLCTPPARDVVDDEKALADFTEYFARNYPGDRGGTLICDPKWHAPRIFRAAKHALQAAALPAVPSKHRFWGAGESECPTDIKAPNGELHTLRCKVCGQDNPKGECQAAQPAVPSVPSVPTHQMILAANAKVPNRGQGPVLYYSEVQEIVAAALAATPNAQPAVPYVPKGSGYEVREGSDGTWGIYTRKFNMRLATFGACSQASRDEIAALLAATTKDQP